MSQSRRQMERNQQMHGQLKQFFPNHGMTAAQMRGCVDALHIMRLEGKERTRDQRGQKGCTP